MTFSDGWYTVLRDDFSGTALNRDIWPVIYNGPHANGAFTYRTGDAIVADGVLTIRNEYDGGNWYAGGISQGANGTAYGRFEFRARVEPGQGTGFIALLWPEDGGWPPEIDILEVPKADRQRVFLTSHGDTDTTKVLYVDATQWHTYTLDWMPGRITYYIDGRKLAEVTKPVPDEEMSLGFQGHVATPNDFWYEGGPDATTPARVDMQIDWVNIASPGFAGSGTGLNVAWYANSALSGAPVATGTGAFANWWNTATTPAELGRGNHFSVRWSGTIESPIDGDVQFRAISDDGVRVFIDGRKVIDNWTPHWRATDLSAVFDWNAGETHEIVVEYNDQGGQSTFDFAWSLADQPFSRIPLAQLSAGAPPVVKTMPSAQYGDPSAPGPIPASIVIESAQIDGSTYLMAENGAAWNAVKVAASAPQGWTDTATSLAYANFVELQLDFAVAPALDLMLIGAKRGSVATGDGADRVTWIAHSNGGWGQTMEIATGAGADEVRIGAVGVTTMDDGVIAHAANGALWSRNYDGRLSTADVQLGAGDDTLTTTGRACVIVDGGDGNDTIRGAAGDDIITGGAGADRLWGGDGRDTFVFARGSGRDWIGDFASGKDALYLPGISAAETTIAAAMQDGVAGTLVSWYGGSAFLAGVATLQADDILFA